jgi:hypothetical protein
MAANRCIVHSQPLRPGRRSCIAGLAVFAVSLWIPAAWSAAEEGPSGREIYSLQCAQCHGAGGEGVEDYCPDPLHGDRPLGDLVQVIQETMPEGEPDQCTDESARKVAEYIYGAFYTAAAREKLQPPRIELARLTVRQYTNTAADLIAGFTGSGRWVAERGLKGQYYKSRSFRGDQRVLERVDGQVDFDFGQSSPLPEKIEPGEFSMQWQGGVIAEQTGEYEFCVATPNAARLWVNDAEKPLIDAWVQSGDMMEHRASIRLLGGRVYQLRLDYFKSTGKDESAAKPASVSLRWQPPHRVEQVVPQRCLMPGWFPEVLVVETEFPPDDSSVGYERGTSVSKSWDEATTYAAVEIANKVVAHGNALSGAKDDEPDRVQKLKDFCYRFAERAFRRPLTDDQRRSYIDQQFAAADDVEAAVKRTVILVLKSPYFLYLGLDDGQLDDYAVAARLSFGLWDSLPDQELLQAAAAGGLQSPEAVEQQARRMLGDPRAKAKLQDFFRHWLRVEHGYDVSKDETLYPDFEAAVLSDWLTSLELGVDHIVWSDASDFRQLLLADQVLVNRRLADFLGVDPPEQAGFHPVSLDADQQAGVLTHPYLMTSFAYHKSSSPIHRGVFIVRSLLGRSLKPPPIAVAPLDEGFDPGLTTRERVALQTKEATCQNCHSMINPLGFSLEHFDAVGRFRSREKEKPIDAAGSYKTITGEAVQFDGARQLAEFLSGSREVHRCFVEQLFHNLVKQPVAAYGPRQLDDLEAAFVDEGFNIQNLMIQIMKSTALKTNS